MTATLTKTDDKSSIKELRLHGYRFVTRLDEQYVILAPIDEASYLLFTTINKPDMERDVSMRGNWFRFVKPVTQGSSTDLYFIASHAGSKRRKRKSD